MRNFIVCFVALFLYGCGFEIVDPGYRGVKISLGEIVGEPLPEGLHFYNPFTTGVMEYKVRQETWEGTTEVFTKDTQAVAISFAVTYYPDPKEVHNIYREIGSHDRLTEQIIRPAVMGSMKDATGRVIADELVQRREQVRASALKEIQDNLHKRSVFVTDIQFTNLDFEDSYEAAVRAKVTAVQEALQAKNQTIQIEEQAKQKVMTAKADAESMRIKSQALAQNKGLVDFEAVQKWNGELPQIMMGGATPFINMDNILKAKK